VGSGLKDGKLLTVTTSFEGLRPRSFRVPVQWFQRSAVIFTLAIIVAVSTSALLVRQRAMIQDASPQKLRELEDEIQSLRIALERKGTPVPESTQPKPGTTTDRLATDEPAPPPPGSVALSGKPGFWNGLADGVTNRSNTPATIRTEQPRIVTRGKYVEFTLNVLFGKPGEGNQQGRIIALARGEDRLLIHPRGALNIDATRAVVDVDRGEFFSVSRFRVLKATFGPMETPGDLREIQVYFFDLQKNLILTETYPIPSNTR
jgi:hypothetical protein